MARKETLIEDARARRDRRVSEQAKQEWDRFIKWRDELIAGMIREVANLLDDAIADAMQLYGDFVPSVGHTTESIDYHGRPRALVEFPARRGVSRRVVAVWTTTQSHERWLYAQRITPTLGRSFGFILGGVSMQDTPDAVLATIGDALDAPALPIVDEHDDEPVDQVDDELDAQTVEA